jgi:putative tryptophan/tyrosine transport system substrate-binding protein
VGPPHMRRRDFIGIFGSAAAWPLAARAQQPAMPVVGFLSSSLSAPYAPMVAAFGQGLKEAGYVEGQNIAIEFRWAENEWSRLPTLAADLIHRQVAAIVSSGGYSSTRAAKQATATIPIVFVSAGDPVAAGLVASINRPGGNITGVNFFTIELEVKRLEVLREIAPKARTIAVLINPRSPEGQASLGNVEAAIRAGGQQRVVARAITAADIETAFPTFVRERADALLVISDPLFTSRRDQVVALAARYSIPAIYSLHEFPTAGGLISYGASITDAYRQAGLYVGRILKGARPTDLPVMQPTKFELVINLRTAKTLGLEVPPTLLARADEVIE